jgi:hypothetical protein
MVWVALSHDPTGNLSLSKLINSENELAIDLSTGLG